MLDFSAFQKEWENYFSPEIVDAIPEWMWEDRIEPLLQELQQQRFYSSHIATWNKVSGRLFSNRVSSVSLPSVTIGENVGSEPAGWSVYVFFDVTDLSILRRLKDYPDETERRQLEENWAAVCTEKKILIFVNPKV